MLYAIIGTDIKKGRDALHQLVDSLRKRQPDASIVSVSDESFRAADVDEWIHGQGLFAPKLLVTLDTITAAEDGEELFVKRTKEFQESDNIFIVYEPAPSAKLKKALEKHAADVSVYDAPKAAAEKRTIFDLADAVGRRDKKEAWRLVAQYRAAGVADEELAGVIHFQIRAIMRAQKTTSAQEAGITAFPYKKAKGFAKNFSADEVRAYSRRLIRDYHDAHRGAFVLGDALEHFVLSL